MAVPSWSTTRREPTRFTKHFEFFRNEALNARNLLYALGSRLDSAQQYGFVLGGPIQKDKTCFSSPTIRALACRPASSARATVPTTLQRQGIFGRRSSIPPRRQSPEVFRHEQHSPITRFLRIDGIPSASPSSLDIRYERIRSDKAELASNNYVRVAYEKVGTRISSAFDSIVC
jgi:hypothetical protein